jgi:hypothetical protein
VINFSGIKKKSERAVIGYAPEDIQRIFPHLARMSRVSSRAKSSIRKPFFLIV